MPIKCDVMYKYVKICFILCFKMPYCHIPVLAQNVKFCIISEHDGMNMKSFRYLVALLFLYHQGLCSLELGVWDVEDISKENNYIGAVKNAFAGTKVNIR